MTAVTGIARRADAIFVVIDIQERLAAVMARRERVIARSSLLVRAAAIMGAPIVVTRQYPRGLGDTEPALSAALEEAESAGAHVVRVDKMTFDCFAEPTFAEAIEAIGRRQIILCGMESHICVTQTALSALRQGLETCVAADSCCSRDDECHEVALRRLSGAGAVVTTSESIAYELVGRAGTDEFKALLEAVKLIG